MAGEQHTSGDGPGTRQAAWTPDGVDMTTEADTSQLMCKGCGAVVPWDASFCPGCAQPQKRLDPADRDDTDDVLTIEEEPTAVPVGDPVDETVELDTGAVADGADAAAVPHDAPTVPHPPAPPSGAARPDVAILERGSLRRRLAITGIAITAAAAIAAATWLLAVVRPVDAALADGQAALATVAAAFTADATEDSLDPVVLDGAAADLEEARAATESRFESGPATRAAAILAAEQQTAAALAAMAHVDGYDLPSWTTTIQTAAAATGTLADVYADYDIVGRADPQLLADGVASIAGDVAVGGIATTTAGLFDTLDDADKIAGIAAVGASATSAGADITTIRTIIEDDKVLDELDRFAATTSALAALSSLDRERLDRWDDLHADLRAAAGSLTAIRHPAVTPLAAAATSTIRETDATVTAAAARVDAWREETAAVRQSIRDDLATLDTYTTGVNARLQRYDSLRTATQAFSDKIKSGAYVTYDEAYTFFYEASYQRSLVRDGINEHTPPDGVAGAHSSLLGVIDRAILAIDAAIEGLAQDQSCWYGCYYADTPGWQRFVSESRAITKDFAAAESSWRSALSSAKTATEARPVPSIPNV